MCASLPSFEEGDVEHCGVLIQELEHEYFESQVVLMLNLSAVSFPLSQGLRHPSVNLNKKTKPCQHSKLTAPAQLKVGVVHRPDQ